MIAEVRLTHQALGDHPCKTIRQIFARVFTRGGRCFAGEHFVNHHAERIDVGPVVHDSSDDQSLWRRVIGRAKLRLVGIGLRAQITGEPEISDLHFPVIGDEDVRRLDVTMRHTPVMGELQCIAKLGDHLARFLRCDLTGARAQMQILTLHIFHHQKQMPGMGLTKVKNGDDVRMHKPGHGACLFDEALCVLGTFGGCDWQNFDGHPAVQGDLTRLVYGTHAADTDDAMHLVLGKQVREFLKRRIRRIYRLGWRLWRWGIIRLDGHAGVTTEKEASSYTDTAR